MKKNIIEYITNGIKNNKIDLSKILQELDDIKSRFPLESLPYMKMEEWVTLGDKYCFINMIENKTSSIASGFIGFNRNRLFYQGKKDPKPLIIKAILKEKRFEGLNDTEIFELYIKEIYEFIKNFSVDNYNPEEYLYGVNVIKAKLIMIYRPDCKVGGFTSKEFATELANFLGINVEKRDDVLGINIKINKYIISKEPAFANVNSYILGRLIWNFYNEYVSTKTKKKYLSLDRENDSKIIEDMESVKLPKKIDLKPKKAKKAIKDNGRYKYPRDPIISKLALKNANYLCECGESHISFIRKSNGKNYTEPHHIIPMSAQEDFEIDLDCLPNIISLCSTCHNKLHYGANIKDMLHKIYDDRKEELEKYGIIITFQELLNYYKR